MTTAITMNPDLLRPLRRFFRTPKGILFGLFAFIGLLSVLAEGAPQVLPGLVAALAVAAVIDVAVGRLDRDAWVFPSGGLLTAAIVAFLLSPFESVIVVMATTVLAIASKHLFRTRLANVFNPAAFGLVVSAILFGSVDSWWGAMPSLGVVGVAVLLVTGIFMADRINKLPMVLTFFGVYFGLFTATALAGSGSTLGEIYRQPDLHAVLFFAFFMLDDPPTCPVKYGDQVVYGYIVALASYLLFQVYGWDYFLPAGLLAGNLYEGVRKTLHDRQSPGRLKPAR